VLLSPLCFWPVTCKSSPHPIVIFVLRCVLFVVDEEGASIDMSSTYFHSLVNVGPLGILLEGNTSPVSLGLTCLYRFPHVILLPLLVKFPDHIVLTLSNEVETPMCVNGVRKVTPPDEELKIIVFSPFVLDYINDVFRLLTS
jgi:hypothetical protein